MTSIKISSLSRSVSYSVIQTKTEADAAVLEPQKAPISPRWQREITDIISARNGDMG